MFQQVRREFRLCAEEAKVAIVKICLPGSSILLRGAAENIHICPVRRTEFVPPLRPHRCVVIKGIQVVISVINADAILIPAV